MKAVAINKFKETPVVMDLPRPVPRPGYILVKMAAAGINPFDWKMQDGFLDGKMPHQFPMILGVDGAGTVEATGEGVTRFKPGDTVYGQFIHAPIGEGAFAEYAIVPEKAAISHAPKKISLLEAASLPTAGMTALQLLETLGLKHEQTLLLVGATGGVGSFVVQLAAMQGIYVIATVGDDAGAERITRLGARETINYRKLSIFAQMKEKYPDGVDGLIDVASNGAAFGEMLQLVREGGAALTTMFVADDDRLQRRRIRGGNFETKGNAASLDALSDAIDNGMLQAPVENVIAMEEVGAALEQSRQAKGKGKTVIKIS